MQSFGSSNSGLFNSRSELAAVFLKQDANYYLNPNSKWILFNTHASANSPMMNNLESLSAEWFEETGICYGGELYPDKMEENAAMLYHLMFSLQKTVILTGAGIDWVKEMQNQWANHFNPYRLSIISEQTSSFTNLDPHCMYMKEMHFIGLQRHYSKSDIQTSNHSIRLGELRSNSQCADPYIRSSEIIYFDLNAIRFSDCPANFSQHPSGLHAEEAAAISRMAGLSDRNKLFLISDWDYQRDHGGVTSELVAQMVWYYWEGCHLKQVDQAVQKGQLTNYQVHLHSIDYVINFYKSEQSGKWWFEEPLVDNEFSNQLIPCTYEEYQLTAKEQIPKRILEKING
ncbi:MAG: hypothetical protein IPM34_07235 [Saprospiraceae bacterium]|nr:hypothetical protein [Saprospiraceae bacterium]